MSETEAERLTAQSIAAAVVSAQAPHLQNFARGIITAGKGADRDIEHRMYEQATLASAQYALEHMVTARPIRGGKYPGNGRLELIEYVLSLAAVDGFYAEFGVYQGETLAFAANRIDKVIYGFDSFEGLPDDWFLGVTKGTFSLNGELPKLTTNQSNYRLVKGWFNETLPGFKAQIEGPAAYLNIDCDLYESTRTIFDELGERIVPGTVIVFDEYLNYPGWQNHEFKAFQEFCKARSVTYRYLAFTPLMFGAAVMIETIGG